MLWATRGAIRRRASAHGSGLAPRIAGTSVALIAWAQLAACGRVGFEPAPDSAGDVDRIVYVATVAECLDPAQPDPAQCRSVNGPDQLVVDLKDSTTDQSWQAYVRFDLDGALADREVAAVTLRLVATDAAKARSPSTGRVWQVAPFTLATLSGETPAQLGAMPLADAQGSAAPGQTVAWPLPVTLVAPNASVFLGLDTTDNDGTNYWNLDGKAPPQLVVDLR